MEASCQCGRLQAQVADEARPFTILCHCTDCQRRTGSPFGVIGYFPSDAVTISGEAREFCRDTYAGNRLTNGFCPSCGSTIYVLLSKNSDMIGVPAGAFTTPHFSPPVISVWEQDRHDWVALPETVARHEKGTD
ncbi:MAG: GFA family protein [Novosphingobium sp.]|nr:GFA family protein [Novosphingobium sp.]